MRKLIDLHLHTTHSDGTDSVGNLASKLRDAGIGEFALTDHNTVSGVAEILEGGDRGLGMKFHAGVEFSAGFHGREIHITAYGPGVVSGEVQRICRNTRDVRTESDHKFIKQVLAAYPAEAAAFGVPYHAYEYKAGRGGWKSLNYLHDLGLIDGIPAFFEFSDQFDISVDFITVEDLLPALNAMGVFPVLAHPTLYQDGDLMDDDELEEIIESGIRGIEVYNSYYQDADAVSHYRRICRDQGLMITGGSDYHGEVLDRRLGFPNFSRDDLDINGFEDLCYRI